MKIEIYPNPLIDLREIEWENDKYEIYYDVCDVIFDFQNIYGKGFDAEKHIVEMNQCLCLDNYIISKIEKKNNTLFCEISIK